MSAETVAGMITVVICSVPYLIMGYVQKNSAEPVGFWTGKNPPPKELVTDVTAYNRKHGRMWLCYGLGMIASFFGGMFFGDELAAFLFFGGEALGGIVLMILYHNHLEKKYVKKNG